MFEWFFACFRPTEGCMALTWCYMCCMECTHSRRYREIVERINNPRVTTLRPTNPGYQPYNF